MKTRFYLLSIFFTFTQLQLWAQSETSVSLMAIPIRIQLTKVASDIDKNIGKIILRDSSLTDNNNDQLQYVITKSKPLVINSIQDRIIKVTVPITVWAQKGIGGFGIYRYGDTKFEMSLSFKIAYNIMTDWTLKTKTYADGYQWISKPALSVAGTAVPLTAIFDQVLKYKQKDIASEIDEQIATNVNLKQNIAELWTKMNQPTLLSDSFQTWMVMTPLSIYAKPFTQDKSSIITTLGFKLFNKTYVGIKPEVNIPNSIPNLQYVNSIPNEFTLITDVFIPYEYLNASIQAMYPTFDIDYTDSKKISLSNITLSPDNGKLKINCLASGAFNGQIELIGLPYFDSSSYSIKMREIDFGFKTKNLFHKSAAWVFNGLIEKKLGQNFEIPMKQEFIDMKSQAEKGLTANNNGVNTTCKIRELKPTSINILEQMTLRISTIGSISLSY